VLKKSKPENSTLFIDASEECVKVTNNNKLTADHIAQIVDAYVQRQDRAHFCRLVPHREVAAQNYNLSVSTYVEAEDTRQAVDIAALNADLRRMAARAQELREEIDRIIAELEGEA